MAKSKAVAFSLPPPAAPRTPVDEQTAARFVGARAQASSNRRHRGERVVLYLPPELAEALRVHCARARQSLSLVGTGAIQDWLDAVQVGQRHK